MPFESAKQEHWMRINQPAIYKRWVKKYGHYPGFKASLKRKPINKKIKTRKRGRK